MKSKTAYPWFYFLRVSRLSLIVFLPTFILILFLYRSSFKQGLIGQMTEQVRSELVNTQETLQIAKMNPLIWCQKLKSNSDYRLTLVDKAGTIVCDSLPEKLGLRVQDDGEIHGAFVKNFASEVRSSDIFKTTSLFAALKINEDYVLRKVIPLSALKNNLQEFDQQLFTRFIPFAVLTYLVFIVLFYYATKPLGIILSKVEKFQADVPFKKTLQQLYARDKWAQIEAALTETDQKMQDQIIQVKTENEKIGTILESIYDDIIAIDPFETILFYNTNFFKSFIRGRRVGEILPKLWHVFQNEDILSAFRSVIKSGETVSLKAMNLLPNQYFDLTVTPLRDARGDIMGALGVFYDVTDFKLTEQMRVDFVANVSHEIRTPLTSIKGYAQVLQSQKNKVDPELTPFLDKILVNTERMISLFNDLLNLSVIESKSELKAEELDIDDMVAEISDGVMNNYPRKRIHFEKNLELKTIKGDQRLMEQVLTNLIDNACKYAAEELTIRVVSSVVNNKARIEVADNGPGIPAEHISRIFERFYRVESSREISRGTGLGLSIVKHIIARHGGTIRAEASDLGGANFIIELPLE
jgi:two-component system phosphate regulon sensor histidine kinase PhoR